MNLQAIFFSLSEASISSQSTLVGHIGKAFVQRLVLTKGKYRPNFLKVVITVDASLFVMQLLL